MHNLTSNLPEQFSKHQLQSYCSSLLIDGNFHYYYVVVKLRLYGMLLRAISRLNLLRLYILLVYAFPNIS